MFKNKTALSYGVIGLGRFGSALARTLAESGSDVLVIDSSPLKVKELRDYTEHAFVAQESKTATSSSSASAKRSTQASSRRSTS